MMIAWKHSKILVLASDKVLTVMRSRPSDTHVLDTLEPPSKRPSVLRKSHKREKTSEKPNISGLAAPSDPTSSIGTEGEAARRQQY